MSIITSEFGKTDKQEAVMLFTIKNANGVSAIFTNWGATLVSLLVPDKNGKLLDVVLGFDTLDKYIVNHCYFGATIGRNGNRVQNSTFKINNVSFNLDKNERNKNNLHSGFNGYQKRLWNYAINSEANAISFILHSPDMDQGFPRKFQCYSNISTI